MSTPETPSASSQTSEPTPTQAASPAAARSDASGASKGRPSAQRPAMSENGVPLARVRRAPRVFPFVITGAVLGAVAGLVIAFAGDDGGNYTEASTVGYLIVLCAALGAMLGGIAFAIADKRS